MDELICTFRLRQLGNGLLQHRFRLGNYLLHFTFAEKAKTPPARPGTGKPEHLVNPPASTFPSSMAGQYPGGPRMPNPGVRPGAPNPMPQGIPFQPRIPGGAFPPGSLPGTTPPRPADPRLFPSGPQGVPARPPAPVGDQRMQAPHPGRPPQTPPDSRNQQMFPGQRVPQAPASPAAGPPMHPSMRPVVPFSQVGPRGPGPAEHLIHSTPRMSYPVPVGPSLPSGGPQGFQSGIPPGGPNQAPQHPSQQPRPQLAPGQVPGPGSAQALPSYDQAKFIPGSQPMNRPPQPNVQPQQGWTQGQHLATSQQQPSGPQLKPNVLNHPPNFASQQQFQSPRGPRPPLQPQHSSQGISPQMYQQQIPSSQMAQSLQPAPSQHQPKSWPTHPFQFPKLTQQSMQPLQPQQQFQQPQQPFQRQQQQPHQPHPQQQFQKPPPGQPQFPQPLEPQKVPQPQSQTPQRFQPQQPSPPQQQPQQPPHFQQQQLPPQQTQHPSQPPQQYQQPIQQFKQPAQVQPQFPQQQMQQPRDPLHLTQFQQTLQPQGQQPQHQPHFLQPMQRQPNYQQQLQPLQPQKARNQAQFQPPLQPPLIQQPPQGQQFPTERLPQQTPHPGQLPSQNMQTSLGSLRPQQMSQIPGSSSLQQQGSTPSPKPSPGYPAQQPFPGNSQGQQPSQSSKTSTQSGYPVLPEKKRSQTVQPSPQHPGLQRPGGMQSSALQQNTSTAPPSSWQYPQASQPSSFTGAPQQFSRQDSIEQQQGFGGKQIEVPPQSSLYKQPSLDQGRGSPLGAQQPLQAHLGQEQTAYPPAIARQNSTDYGKQTQYSGQSRDRLLSYPPYSGVVSKPSAPPGGSQPYSYTPGSASTAPPLVQGVRPSPTSLPPSSAYANSYSVSVAQAQLSQQQQMQQLQTQMLLQQQQLIIQQQELLRHQQQQQQHESDQGQLTQLFQQVLQQQTKLGEMEQKLAEHERHEEQLKKEQEKTEHEEPSPHEKDNSTSEKDPNIAEKETLGAEKDTHIAAPHSSGSFSASWGSGFSDYVHGKLDMEQVFSNLAKKQISEISEMGKHPDVIAQSSKTAVHEDNEAAAPKKDCSSAECSEKAIVGDENTETKCASGTELDISLDDRKTTQVVDAELESAAPGEESNEEKESSGSVEGNGEDKSEIDSSSSDKGKQGDEATTTEPISDEDKEKKRRQEIEEQIQKIKELQKNAQPGPPPLPQKQKYLYEPGKMPELNQLPLKPPDAITPGEPTKPSLHRQCGHYYSTQQSSIGQEENNECLNEEEYIQRLSRTVETFDALVVSLGQKRENSPYSGFISEWKVSDNNITVLYLVI